MAILSVSSSNKDQYKEEISAKRLFPDAQNRVNLYLIVYQYFEGTDLFAIFVIF